MSKKGAPEVESEAEILVLQADGKGVPMVVEPVEPPKRRLGKGQKTRSKKRSDCDDGLYYCPQQT